MAWQKTFIERIRREKFSIGAQAHNPLAPELHQAIKQLSVELYQNDIHFIKELIQNAEDNIYDSHVIPSLEFMLTKEDVAGVGASATLLVLNNEIGLSIEDVRSLCSVASSTKIGKRDKGYIGCKGIGFKSVFMVCETPIMISNGYRISFRGEASEEARVGYIVPEWRDSPTDGAIMGACGRAYLPITVIILPIRDGKVDLVRKQLKEISPEIILFLSRLRELTVIDKTDDALNSGELLKITRSDQISGITSNVYKFSKVTLSVKSSGKELDAHSYIIFQQSFPVTHPVQERKEIEEWGITLAFPSLQGRAPSGNVGDVFSFLPTELRTGYPFIINADFILTSSRETIRFDSAWNVGILNCIPAAFRIAFKIMLRMTVPLEAEGIKLTPQCLLDKKDAYKYLPCNNVENAYRHSRADSNEQRHVRQKLHIQPHQAGNIQHLEKVRSDILHALGKEDVVLLSNNVGFGRKPGSEYFYPPCYSLQVKSSFLTILESAAQSNHPAPSVATKLSGSGKSQNTTFAAILESAAAKLSGSGKSQNTTFATNLESAAAKLLVSEKSQSTKFAIVDGYVQQNYATGLTSLGVPQMTAAQYNSFLTDSEWLLKLPEELYVQILTFFALEMKVLAEGDRNYSTSRKTFRLVKVRGEKGGQKLVTLDEVSKGTEFWYTSSVEGAEWISQWVMEFSPWHPAKVMTTETSEALRNATSSEELMRWFRKHGSLTELTIQNYSQKVIQRLMVGNKEGLVSLDGRKHSILLMQFLFTAIQKSMLSWPETVQQLGVLAYVNIVEHHSRQTRNVSLKMRLEGGLLLPPKASKWPLLLDGFQGSPAMKRLVALSDMYLEPQCSLVADIVSTSSGPVSMLEFIKQSFEAVDIPSIKIPTYVPLPFRYPVTIEKSVLLLQWLQSWLPNRRKTKKEGENDVFLKSLKTLGWIQTVHHGWQCPTSVFLGESDFCGDLTSQDLPFLDLAAYSVLDFTNSDMLFVLDELEVVKDMRKGCAVVADYFARLPAEDLHQEAAERFYSFLHETQWREETHRLKIWNPATTKSKVPFWRNSDECMLRDEDNLFADSNNLTVLEKVYGPSLLPFFSEILRVPERAAVDLYCELWLQCCQHRNLLTLDDVNTPKPLCMTGLKVHSIWKNLILNWPKVSKEVWEVFVSQAWVPVGQKSKGFDHFISESICILPPGHVFIPDDLSMFELFRKPTSGKLDFVWLLPGLSNSESKSLTEIYSAMGVKKLSNFVKSDVSFPARAWTRQVPPGQGLISAGLLRTVLAYLCQREYQYGLPNSVRQKILFPLLFTDEVVVSEPFKKSFTLQTESFSSTGTVKENTLAHYDRFKGKLFYLRKDHALLQTAVTKRDFNTQFAKTLADGILFEHPEIAPGLIKLLKLLGDSNFDMECVEYELGEQNLAMYPEDEKALMSLMENLGTRYQTNSAGEEFMISESNFELEYLGNTRSNSSRALQLCGPQSSLSPPLSGSDYLMESQDSGSYGQARERRLKQKFLSK